MINRDAVKKELRKAIHVFEKGIARQSKSDPKKFLKYVNGKMQVKSGIGDLLSSDGSIVSEEKEKTEVFNKFFGSVLTKEYMQSIPDVVNVGVENQLRDLDSTIGDVLKILDGLRSNKSPGPDRIHPCVLKECATSLALPVYLLFRQSMDEGHLPQT